MAAPFTPDQPFKDINVINESERSVDPTDDVGKLVQLESDGRIAHEFLAVKPLSIHEFTTPGAFTWTKPNEGTFALVELWAAGASGAAVSKAGNSNWWIATGGGGGEYRKFVVPISELNATEAGTIGTGGVSRIGTAGAELDGANGGDTLFKGIIANGGKAGLQDGVVASGTLAGGAGGVQQSFAEGGGSGGDATSSDTVNNGQARVISGGGGGGGKNRGSNAPSVGPSNGGASILGGNGGNGAVNSGNSTAQAGTAPGGGGGGALTVQTTGTATSGAGGNGMARISVF